MMWAVVKMRKHNLTATLGSLVLIHLEFIWSERSYLSISHFTLWISGTHLKVSLLQSFHSRNWGGQQELRNSCQWPHTSLCLSYLASCIFAWVLQILPSALGLEECCGESGRQCRAGEKQWKAQLRKKKNITSEIVRSYYPRFAPLWELFWYI